MRFIEDHKIDSERRNLRVAAVGEVGPGGANHKYEISGFDLPRSMSNPLGVGSFIIELQNGPIKDVGVNGVTNEILLAIVADRLRAFQEGPFSCKANACALTHIEEAMHWLHQRTLERIRRGVEGTLKV